jgi:hypothetical protein
MALQHHHWRHPRLAQRSTYQHHHHQQQQRTLTWTMNGRMVKWLTLIPIVKELANLVAASIISFIQTQTALPRSITHRFLPLPLSV